MAIGFLFAALIGIAFMPAVHGRAVRLTERRLEAALPQDMNEIQADKDALRAEFAMETRRLELAIETLRNRNANQLIEISKKSDNINQLKLELNAIKMVAAKVVAAYSSRGPIVRQPVPWNTRGRDGMTRFFSVFASRRSSGWRPRENDPPRRAG
jgi:hypothetical protein